MNNLGLINQISVEGIHILLLCACFPWKYKWQWFSCYHWKLTREKKHVVGNLCLKYNNVYFFWLLFTEFQDVLWQTIKTLHFLWQSSPPPWPEMLCWLGVPALSLYLEGMVCSSVIKLQISVAVQAFKLSYRGTTQHILLKITDSILSEKNIK